MGSRRLKVSYRTKGLLMNWRSSSWPTICCGLLRSSTFYPDGSTCIQYLLTLFLAGLLQQLVVFSQFTVHFVLTSSIQRFGKTGCHDKSFLDGFRRDCHWLQMTFTWVRLLHIGFLPGWIKVGTHLYIVQNTIIDVRSCLILREVLLLNVLPRETRRISWRKEEKQFVAADMFRWE